MLLWWTAVAFQRSSLFRDGSEKRKSSSRLPDDPPSVLHALVLALCIAAVREEPNSYYSIPPLANVTILLSRHVFPLPSINLPIPSAVGRSRFMNPRPENPPSRLQSGVNSALTIKRTDGSARVEESTKAKCCDDHINIETKEKRPQTRVVIISVVSRPALHKSFHHSAATCACMCDSVRQSCEVTTLHHSY